MELHNFEAHSVVLKGTDMQTVEDRVRQVITEEKFGIVSVVDVQKTLKKKMGVDISPYLILGACSPPKAYSAIQMEDDIGILMPCNVLLREDEPGQVTVAF
jgi:uncharacterized protein (DUF302 family)